MVSLENKLLPVKTALTAIRGLPVSHYFAAKRDVPYCVYAEDVEVVPVSGDNQRQEQTLHGTTDLYTKTENDPLFDAVQNAFNNAKISFVLNSVQYEDTTGYIHYEWAWEV